MEMPKAKWLKPYSGFILITSVIEICIVAPVNLFHKISLSVFSLMSVFAGFGFSVLILCGCFLLPKITATAVEFQHMQNCRDAANLLFIFGIIVSGMVVFLYPWDGFYGIVV